MISTITAPAHTVTPAAPRESARRSLLAGGATIGTIHEAGTSFSKGQERRSRAMISPASRLSTAAPSSLRITRAYGQPSSARQSCNPSGNVRREELGRAYQPRRLCTWRRRWLAGGSEPTQDRLARAARGHRLTLVVVAWLAR
jgi:hypothetical protein